MLMQQQRFVRRLDDDDAMPGPASRAEKSNGAASTSNENGGTAVRQKQHAACLTISNRDPEAAMPCPMRSLHLMSSHLCAGAAASQSGSGQQPSAAPQAATKLAAVVKPKRPAHFVVKVKRKAENGVENGAAEPPAKKQENGGGESPAGSDAGLGGLLGYGSSEDE